MWNPGEKTTVIGITKDVVDLGRPLSFTLVRGETPIVIDTNLPPSEKLSDYKIPT